MGSFYFAERSMNMARIRTLPKAVQEIKAQDPNTYINVRLLRKWVKGGLVKPIQGCGTYQLIDLDKLEAFLSGGAYADR